MLDLAQELDAFKRQINLIEYATSSGYVVDRKASSRSSSVMAHPNGDKIVLAVGEGGHWIYFSVRDDEDNGSIIDFVQHRHGGSLGDVRRKLRAFMRRAAVPLPTEASFPMLSPATKDLVRVRARFEGMAICDAHPYLVSERRIPAEVLRHCRFAGRIRIDSHGNAIFSHWNSLGLSGFEMKNHAFTGFAAGGEKGLRESGSEPGDTALVICETGIDVLSHFALKRPEGTRYVSTAGSLNASQPALIRRAAEELPDRGRVILATDNDAGGDSLVSFIREFLTPLATRLVFFEDRPSRRGEDWNDVLKRD